MAEKKIGLMDLARALGISIGTVDRALHGRPGVNPMTRARVVQMARTLGYRPNLAARALASRRPMRIAAVLPRCDHEFFSKVAEGILEGARALESTGVSVDLRQYPWLKGGEKELTEAAVEDGVRGLIIAPGSPEAVRGAIRKASRKNIPVVCVATDAPDTERLTAIRADPATSGAMAAELLGRVLGGKGTLAVVTGCLETTTHAENVEGFRRTLAAEFPEMYCTAAIEAHDDPEEAYLRTRELFGAGDLAGVYVSTSNSIGVLRALDEVGRKLVVTTDLFPALARRIRDGSVLASIYQRPRHQGWQAFRALHRFLTEGVCPPARIGFPPQIILRSNLELFLKKPRKEGST